MTRLVVFAGVCLLSALAGTERIRYDNYPVYKAIPSNEAQIALLKELDGSTDKLIFLNQVTVPEAETYIVVPPYKLENFQDALNQAGVYYEVVEKNLQRQLDAEIAATPLHNSSKAYDWTQYHTLEETYQWLEDLAAKYPKVQTFTAGKTYEGREIRGAMIYNGRERKAIFIEGGIHAREWISPAVCTYILNELVTSQDPDVNDLFRSYNWYFVIHANPDGYVYTHTTDRLWRKTRSKNGACYGADPNRNWDYHWNEIGASSQPCSDTYAGSAPFSEIETRTMAEYISSIRNSIRLYISFHSFSQLILFPFGHTKSHAYNHEDLLVIADAAATALGQRYGTRFKFGNIYETIYPAAGSSIDWAYGAADYPLTYTYELRPASGWNGFILPPEQIIPSGEETMDSVVAMIQKAHQFGYI